MLVPAVTGTTTTVKPPRLRLPFRIRITDLNMFGQQIRSIGDSGQANFSIFVDRNNVLTYLFTLVIRGDSQYQFILSFDPVPAQGRGAEMWVSVPTRADLTIGSVPNASVVGGAYAQIDFLRDRVEIYFTGSRLITFSHDLKDIYTSMLTVTTFAWRGGTAVTGSPVVVNVEFEQLFDASEVVAGVLPVTIAIGVIGAIVSVLTKLKI